MGNSILQALHFMYEELLNSDADILNDIKYDYITENVTRGDRLVLWYYEPDTEISKALYVDTLELLTDSEIEKELL